MMASLSRYRGKDAMIFAYLSRYRGRDATINNFNITYTMLKLLKLEVNTTNQVLTSLFVASLSRYSDKDANVSLARK